MWFDIAIMGVLNIACIVLYMRLAPVWKLMDVPNARSSHQQPTLRGAGILFIPLILFVWLWKGFGAQDFIYVGILLAAGVGMVDDIKGLSAAVRAVGYLAALCLAGVGLGIPWMTLPLWMGVLWLIVGTGVINAWNFMDGINGITVLYTGVVTMSLWTACYHLGIENYTFLFLGVMMGLCGVGWLNVRRKAIAFMGDVGSVFLGIVVVLWMSGIMEITKEPGYILLVLLYGLDSVITIGERLWRGENIIQAHRSHLYQYLANEMRWPHLRVASIYAGIQALVNVCVLWYIRMQGGIGFQKTAMIIVISAMIYIFLKYRVKRRLIFFGH